MAQRFEATATGLMDGRDYRVEIYDTRYTGASIEGTLDDEKQWISIPTGEGDNTGAEPLVPREFQLSVFETTDLSVLRDAAEDDIRVEVYNASTGVLIYKGYVDPNNVGRRPIGPQPARVQLMGVEGLPTLSNSDISDLSWSSLEQVTMMTAIRTILNHLYPTALDIEVGVHWYPEGLTASGDPLPLQEKDFFVGGFRENRPDGGNWYNLLRALKQVLKVNGCTLQQTVRRGQLVWWITHRGAYKSNGHIDTWEVLPDGTINFLGDQDVTKNFDALVGAGDIDFPTQPETAERMRQSVTVTYDHPDAQNYLREAGFEEDGAQWTIESFDVKAADVVDHSNRSDSPSATSGDQKVAEIVNDTNSATGKFEYPVQQTGISPVFPDENAFLKVQIDGWRDGNFLSVMQVKIGSTYFTTTRADIRSGVLPGEVALPVGSLDYPIAKGAKVPVVDPNDNVTQTLFEVTERAAAGDTVLRGRVNIEIRAGWKIEYIRPTANTGQIDTDPWIESDRWKSSTLHLPAQDANGNAFTDETLDVKIGVDDRTALSQGDKKWLFDNVVLQPVKQGSVLNQVKATASTDSTGEAESFEQGFGSGPTDTTISRIRDGRFWGIGPDPSPVWGITELKARERLRYFRSPNDRFGVTVLTDNNDIQIWGHEVFVLEGTNYRVTQVDPTPSAGEIRVTGLQHKDYGTS